MLASSPGPFPAFQCYMLEKIGEPGDEAREMLDSPLKILVGGAWFFTKTTVVVGGAEFFTRYTSERELVL